MKRRKISDRVMAKAICGTRQRHAAIGDDNKRRAKQAGAAAVDPNAGIYSHEERKA